MTLLPDWKAVLKKAWSVKMLTAIAVLSAVETMFSLVADETLVPQPLSAAIKGVLAAAGILLRVLAQKEAAQLAGVEDASGK